MAAREYGEYNFFCKKFQLKAGFKAKTGPLHSIIRLGKNLLSINGQLIKFFWKHSSGRMSI